MSINDAVNDAIEMMDKVEKETKVMKDKLDDFLTIARKYREYIENFHPEIHNQAVKYIKEKN